MAAVETLYKIIEDPPDVKESKVMDLKLCYNTFNIKEGVYLTQTFTRYKALMNELVNDGIKLSKLEINTGFINGLPKKWLSFCQSLRNTNHVKDFELDSLFGKLKYEENLIDSDFQDSPDDEEDTRSSHEYLNDLEEEYQAKALLAKSKRFFKKVPSYQSPFQPRLLLSSENKPKMRNTKDFKAKYNKDKEEVSSDDEESEVKALMALTDEEIIPVGKESARNDEWTKITIKKVHTLLEMEDNEDRKSFLDYLYIDLNYVEEQRNNLSSKHRNLVQELNACKEQILVLKQAKLDLFTMQHVNTEILKENQNLRLELKELTSIIETWLNSSNKVNQYNLDMSITSSNLHKLSEAEDSTLPNHDTDEVPSNKSQRNTIDPSAIVSDSPASDYDSADESSVCSTPLLPLKKVDGAEPVSGPKTVKLILKSKSMFKAKNLKGITLNEPSSAPARGNKSSSASKTNSAPAGKLKNVKVEDDPPLARHHTGQGESSFRSRPSRPSISFPSCIHCGYNNHHSDDCLLYPTCEICGSYDHNTHDHNRIISQRRGINPRNPQHVTKNYETCGSNVHTTSDHNDIEWFRKRETPHAKKAESSNALRSKTLTKRWASRQN
ncbi:hypothetical protein Tco_1107501 [Tanacetum coccineum]